MRPLPSTKLNGSRVADTPIVSGSPVGAFGISGSLYGLRSGLNQRVFIAVRVPSRRNESSASFTAASNTVSL